MNRNKSEKCEEIMNQYLMLDKGEAVPLKLSLHMLFCKNCRKSVKLLKIAEKASSAPIKLETPYSDESIRAVMNKVSPGTYEKISKKPVSISAWIVSGLIMIVLLLLATVHAQNFQNRDLTLAYSILIAVCVTVYCSAFVIGNIDYFVKKISAGIQL